MHRVAVRCDRGDAHRAVVVDEAHRLLHRVAAARDRAVMRLTSVIDAVRDDAHAVTVAAHVLGHVGVTVERAGDDEADVALRQHVRLAVAPAGLGARVGDHGEPEAGREELRGVAGVPHPPFDVVEAGEGGRRRLRRGLLTTAMSWSVPAGRPRVDAWPG